jgi:site-specific DNA recombinase
MIIVFQTSRLWRNRKERAEGIEILRAAEISVVAAKGPSLDCSTAYGRMMAGLLGEFDTAETDVMSERQILAARSAAARGTRWTGCPRPSGWAADHKTLDPAEAVAIDWACMVILQGSTLSAVCREWTRRGLYPPQPRRTKRDPFGPLPRPAWSRVSVKTILCNPSIAGIPSYRGEEISATEPADWQPVVTEETYRAVCSILTRAARCPAGSSGCSAGWPCAAAGTASSAA